MGKLTKIPYLVLFILLGAVGVGTASALVTITLAGDVNVEGILGIGINDAGNDDIIKFDDGTEKLTWDDAQTRFEFDDELAINGPIQTASTVLPPVSYNRIGTGTALDIARITDVEDLLVADDLEVDGDLLLPGNIIRFRSDSSEFLGWSDSSGEFNLSGPLQMGAYLELGFASTTPSCSANPDEGRIYYDTSDDTFCFCQGNPLGWTPLDGVGSCS